MVPSLRDHALASKILSRYRLEIAIAVVSYAGDLIYGITGHCSSAYVAELCDAYALKVFFDWLCTKYGFPLYAMAINKPNPESCKSLGDLDYFFEQYPFSQCRICDLPKQALSKAVQLLESNLKPDISHAGSLYEQIIGSPLVIQRDARPHIKKESSRKLIGQFYTPSWIVDYCYDRAAETDLSSFISCFKAEQLSGSLASLPDKPILKVLDPACGTGNFLLGGIAWLAKRELSALELVSAATHSFYGQDTDGRAVSLCRASVVIGLARQWCQIVDKQGALEAALRFTQLTDSLTKHVIVCDSIFGAAAGGDQMQNFDLVITNPPYISFGSRNQPELASSTSRYLRTCLPASTEYKIRLHSVFQEISFKYARRGGKVVLFLPDAFLSGTYYQKLRRYLLQSATIDSITEFPDDAVGGATVGRWCVAAYTKNGSDCNGSSNVALYSFVDETAKNAGGKRDSLPRPVLQKGYELPISAFVSPDKTRFRLVWNDIERDLWLYLDRLPVLSRYFSGHTGLRALHGQATIVSPQAKGASWRPGITSGKSVSRHWVSWDGMWLDVDPSLLFPGGHDSSVVERPKLLVRQTADRIIASCDYQGLYHLNNVHSLRPLGSAVPAKADLDFWDGLLNSSLWLYLYQSRSREAGRVLAQIDIDMLESMPVPPCLDDKWPLVARLVRLARRLLAALDEKGKTPPVINCLTTVERSIDSLAYDLYNLEQPQIDHIESFTMSKLTPNSALPDETPTGELLDMLELKVSELLTGTQGGLPCASN